MKKEKEFKKQLVWFDERSYAEEVSRANWKLFKIQDAFKWCEERVNPKLIDKKRFMNEGFSKVFLDAIKEENKDKIQLDISASKLANLLDISVAPLLEFQHEYNKIDSVILLEAGEYKVEISQETYKRYTKNEKENEALDVANELISVLGKIDKHRTIRPAFIQNAFQNFIRYDFRDNKYLYNIDYR